MTNGQMDARRGKARTATAREIAPSRGARPDRGRYFTLKQVTEAYPVFTPRLVRRLVQQRRIPFSRVGRCIVLAEADIEAYIQAQRVEPPAEPMPWSSIA